MASQKQIIFVPFRLDLADERLFRGEDEVHLHPKAFAVLRCLTDRSGMLVTKQHLIETIWPGLHVSDAVLTVSIRELRKALNDNATRPRFIETVHRRGYRFIAAIESFSRPTQDKSAAQPVSLLFPDEKTRTVIVSEVASAIGVLPLVGREKELAFLSERLEAALRGEGSVVFITGEAGIGKTRLAMEVRRHAQEKGCPWLAGKYDKAVSEPYKAWAEILRSSIREGSSLRSMAGPHTEQLAKIAPEIGTPGKTFPGGPDTERRRLLEALSEFLIQVSRQAPLVLFLDDLQWAASIEPVHHLSRRIGNQPILILAAYREDELREYSSPWSTVLEMNRQRLFHPLPLKALDQREVAKLISQRIEGMTDSRLVELLYRKTQGNPFFLEEMLRLLQHQDAIVHTEGGWHLREQAALEIPDSVKAVVREHVQRFGKDAADLVRAASVCGREFPLRVLTELTGQPEETVVQILDRCEAGGLVQSLPLQAEEIYRFCHDLWQESLYNSVGPAQRRRLHLGIGGAIEKLYAADLRGHFDALAYHFCAGNQPEKALLYCVRAAERAVSVHAHGRAVAYLEQALAALARLPESEEMLTKAIDIRVKLGTSLSSVKGYGAPEVKENYSQARELCRALGETPQLFPVLWGLSLSHRGRRALQESKQIGEQLISLAERARDPELLLEAHHTLGATLFNLGEFVPAQTHLKQGDALYVREHHRHHAFLYGGHDPGVCCRQHVARTLLLIGYPDQALDKSKDALALARRLSHPFSLGHALLSAAVICIHRGDWQTAEGRAEEMLRLGKDESLPRWIARGTILCGRVLAERQTEQGIALMCQGLSAWEGEPLQRDYFSALLAEASLKFGEVEQGFNEVRQAFDRVQQAGIYYYESELYRLKGELLLRLEVESPVSRVQEAEACFREAIRISCRQEAKSLELRAVMSLSRLWRHQGKQDEAQRMLADVYGWFSEGFDTRDLQEAKALLNELS